MTFLLKAYIQLRLSTALFKSVKTLPCIAQVPHSSILTLRGSQTDNRVPAHALKSSAFTSSQRRNFTGTNRNLRSTKNVVKETWTPIDPLDVTELKSNVDKVIEQLKVDLSKLRGGGRFDYAVVEQLRVQLQKGSKETVKLGTLAQIVPKSRFLNVVVGEPEVESTSILS